MGPQVEPTHRERKRWAEGSLLEAIVLHDPARLPEDLGHEMGKLQLLVLCPRNQPGCGSLWLLGHICSVVIVQGPRSFCGWLLLGRVK